MNGKDLTSSELQRPNGALLCLRGAGITRDNPFPAARAQWNLVSQFKNILLQAHFEPQSVSFALLHGQSLRSAESVLALYFSGEEDALSFTVGSGDRLQLEEIQQHLDLRGNRKQKGDKIK